MLVGEPSLMGGEMDDEDERYITRLENTQYDPSVVALQQPSLLNPKPPINSNLNPIKREQTSFPSSPQQLPSMFSNNSPMTNGNVQITSVNNEGEVSKVSTNSPQTPQV
jgi:LIM domain-binding protein 1